MEIKITHEFNRQIQAEHFLLRPREFHLLHYKLICIYRLVLVLLSLFLSSSAPMDIYSGDVEAQTPCLELRYHITNEWQEIRAAIQHLSADEHTHYNNSVSFQILEEQDAVHSRCD